MKWWRRSESMVTVQPETQTMTDPEASPEASKAPPSQRQPDPTPTMESPAIYRICVRGTLASTWSNRLAGMQISPIDGGETILVGRLADQAALSGVLNALYELHLPVSSVECLEAG